MESAKESSFFSTLHHALLTLYIYTLQERLQVWSSWPVRQCTLGPAIYSALTLNPIM